MGNCWPRQGRHQHPQLPSLKKLEPQEPQSEPQSLLTTYAHLTEKATEEAAYHLTEKATEEAAYSTTYAHLTEATYAYASSAAYSAAYESEAEDLSVPVVTVEPFAGSRQPSPPPRDEVAAVIEMTPFIEKIQTFECGVEGTTFDLPEHGVAVNIDKDIIAEGEKVQFEIGVSLYGPFHFLPNHQPISPILWLCMEEENVPQKPIKITIPHCLVDLRDHEVDKYGVRFAKANHNHTQTTPDGKRVFVFEPCTEEEQHFNGSFGYIITTHCCYMCIEANKTRDVALRSGYCLSVVERPISSSLHLVHVCATFYLETCFEVLKQQYPEKEGYTLSFHEFQFNKPQSAAAALRVIAVKPDGFTVALEPDHGQISLSDIDFWKRELDIQQMKTRHEIKTYPPRIKLEVSMANSRRRFLFKLCFEGCKSDNRDIAVERILPKDSFTVTSDFDDIDGMPSSKKQRFDTKHELSTADLKVVRRATDAVRSKWKDVGTELDVPTDTLDEIAANHLEVCDRFREMLVVWLKMVNPKPTWEGLVDALRGPVVGEEKLAESVRENYCPLYIPV